MPAEKVCPSAYFPFKNMMDASGHITFIYCICIVLLSLLVEIKKIFIFFCVWTQSLITTDRSTFDLKQMGMNNEE